MKPGIYPNIPNADYHADPAMSNSGFKHLKKSAAHYREYRENGVKDTPALTLGRAFHQCILEPNLFEKEWAFVPGNAPKKPTKAQVNAKEPSAAAIKSIGWWEKFNADHEGMTILNKADYENLLRMRDATYSHPGAAALLEYPGQVETSYFWIDKKTGEQCKCRTDKNRNDRIVLDIKSTEDASPESFSKSVANYMYHVQDSFYLDGLTCCTGQTYEDFVFIAIEKSPPYGVACYRLNSEDREYGRYVYEELLMRLAQAKCDNRWNPYPNQITELKMPKWAIKEV